MDSSLIEMDVITRTITAFYIPALIMVFMVGWTGKRISTRVLSAGDYHHNNNRQRRGHTCNAHILRRVDDQTVEY